MENLRDMHKLRFILLKCFIDLGEMSEQLEAYFDAPTKENLQSFVDAVESIESQFNIFTNAASSFLNSILNESDEQNNDNDNVEIDIIETDNGYIM
ncbi:MAG: hypothetical protein WDA06_01420 [Phenylobacterium sp.]